MVSTNVWKEDLYSGRVVAVSGAASGIGAAVSLGFLRAGATVVGGDVNDVALTRFVERLPAPLSERFVPLALDVSRVESADGFVAAVHERFGRMDVLINNAGIAPVGSVTETSNELWRRVMSVDVDGAFFLARAALPYLIPAQGSIVNTASVSGTGADFNYAAYNAAKGAIVNLTRSMAIDYGRSAVRVNAIAPGPVRTPLLENNFQAVPGLQAAFDTFIPLGRIADPGEIADAALFLASPAASFITGVILPIDGGVTAWNGQPNGDFVS